MQKIILAQETVIFMLMGKNPHINIATPMMSAHSILGAGAWISEVQTYFPKN